MNNGILPVNLGSPDSLLPADLKKYLLESFITLSCLIVKSQKIEFYPHWIDNWATTETPFS